MTIPNAENNKKNGIGPDIWLAGDPEDLKDWMDKGVKGIVTNTVVLKDMTDKYGSIIEDSIEFTRGNTCLFALISLVMNDDKIYLATDFNF